VGLLIVYIGLVIVGDLAAYLIGLSVERYWPTASLPVFLFLYFFFLWVAWVLAVKITAPKTPAGTAPAAS
jgi:hypothetical protein